VSTSSTPSQGGGASPFTDYNLGSQGANYGSTVTPKGGSNIYEGGGLPQTAANYSQGTQSLYPSAAGAQDLSAAYTPILASAIGGPTGYNPAQTTAYGNSLSGSAEPLGGYVNQSLTTGYDPQNALFQQQSQLLQDQTRAAEAAQGVAGTPYGASVEGQTMGNFDLQWLNQEQARQQAAAQTASTLLQGEGSGLTAGQNLAAAGPETQSQLLQNAQQGIQSGMAPTQTVLSDLLSYLTSQQQVQLGASQQQQQGLNNTFQMLQGIQQPSTPKNTAGYGQGVGGIGQGLGTALGPALAKGGKLAAAAA
jgi:hypothetical protein